MGTESNRNTEEQDSNASKELKREFRWVERITISTNIILAIVGIFALRAYYGQLAVMQGTLNEMKRSGESASMQASRVINNMNWLAQEMHSSVDESRLAIETSRRQNDASIRAIQDQNRPWIQIVNIKPRNQDGHALTFTNRLPSKKVHFEVFFWGDLEIRNVGYSVATHTTIGYEVFVSDVRQIYEPDQMLKEQRRFCSAFLRGSIVAWNPGVLVFSDEPYTTQIGDAGRIRQINQDWDGSYIRSVAVIGCVNYQATFSSKIYQSGFVSVIAHTNDAQGSRRFLIGKNLTKEEIRLYRLEGADYAK